MSNEFVAVSASCLPFILHRYKRILFVVDVDRVFRFKNCSCLSRLRCLLSVSKYSL